MAVFARGIDHVLPNIHADDEECEKGKGRIVICQAGQEIPDDVLSWFQRHKPHWIAGYKKGDPPKNKMVEPMSTAKK